MKQSGVRPEKLSIEECTARQHNIDRTTLREGIVCRGVKQEVGTQISRFAHGKAEESPD